MINSKSLLDTPLLEDLCEFIGILIGDGCISGFIKKSGKSQYHISITGDSKLDKVYLTKTVSRLVENLFKVKANPCFRTNSNTLVLNIYSKNLFDLITSRFDFVPGKKSKTAKIPNEIMFSNKNLQYRTIRGIFDTDGCFFTDKRPNYKTPYPRIHIVTISKTLFEQILTILSKDFKISKSTVDTKWNKRYNIVIYGHINLKKWMVLIGSSNEKHLLKIKEVLKEPLEGFEPPTPSLQNSCSNQLSYKGI